MSKKKVNIILKQDVENLGMKGQIQKVSLGFARNFLLPQKLAILGTKELISQAQAKQEKIKNREKGEEEKARLLKDKLEKTVITIKAKTAKDQVLFGAVTEKDITRAIKTRLDIDVNKNNIFLSEQIKKTGEYTVTIKLFKNIKAKTKLLIETDRATQTV